MAQLLHIHPHNPQARLLHIAVQFLQQGGVIAVPTDSSYALACHLDDKSAVEQMRRIRGIDDRHHLTLLCRDLSNLSLYAKVDNRQFKLLKSATPGPYTFILHASKEVPKRVSHPQRKSIGLRVPDHRCLQALLALHQQPLLATTLIPPGQADALNNAQEIFEKYGKALASVVDAGPCALEPTTVVDLTPMDLGTDPVVLRKGRGDLNKLNL